MFCYIHGDCFEHYVPQKAEGFIVGAGGNGMDFSFVLIFRLLTQTPQTGKNNININKATF